MTKTVAKRKAHSEPRRVEVGGEYFLAKIPSEPRVGKEKYGATEALRNGATYRRYGISGAKSYALSCPCERTFLIFTVKSGRHRQERKKYV